MEVIGGPSHAKAFQLTVHNQQAFIGRQAIN
jgi:hypothetical protein